LGKVVPGAEEISGMTVGILVPGIWVFEFEG